MATRIIWLRGNPLRAVAQLGSALRSGRRGPGFKSRQPDQHGVSHVAVQAPIV